MTKDYARDFWQKFLRLACNGNATMSIENPASDFTTRAKSGEFDSITDEKYSEMLADVEQVQPLWNNQPRRAAGDVLLDALSRTTIYSSRMSNIVELLAESSVHSDYHPSKHTSNYVEMICNARQEYFTTIDADMEYDKFWSPRAIYGCLERIHGQEEAKRAASVIIYNHVEGRRSNTIFCGPTGCGKSEIWRCMAQTFPSLIRMIDASRMTADGWKGSVHIRDIFEGIPVDQLKDGMIVVLDEADKICCETAAGSGGTNYNALTQNSLLKILDGDLIEFGREDGRKEFSVDCSKVSVVLLGAFETLMQRKSGKNSGGIGFGATPRVECDYSNTEITYADLIDAGMRREIAGRINRIVPLRPLDIADYKAILTNSVLTDMQSAIKCEINIDDDSVNYLAEQAATTGLGVRWMKSQIMNAVDDLMFDNPAAGAYTIKILSKEQKDRECCPPMG